MSRREPIYHRQPVPLEASVSQVHDLLRESYKQLVGLAGFFGVDLEGGTIMQRIERSPELGRSILTIWEVTE